jgi:hypothetical protein
MGGDTGPGPQAISCMTSARVPAGVLQAVNRRDVGMIERGKDLGYALETSHALRITCESGRKNLDGYIAPQLRIPGAIHLPHPARADNIGDFIRAEPRPSC